ncbi:ABC transporter substrate-binding protein [Neorhizobium sp. CSC1952]|uniref:ABC transporter substrate-binding protein n=1 Tax=Neorhizobium sp. CSC1952 TaxID=2978974 RepID=UPI0025A589B7|nr:ABC transporter substrate-binding protein [Rhizobium sp. CSC1952]WJR65036.1 ABC transporter substrate-binding protein [Rhizobium sp. CSC1952]
MATRRDLLKSASLLAASSAVSGFPSWAFAQSAGGPSTPPGKTLRIIGESLQSLDPIWTTAPPTKNYAFMIFDQLFAVDDKYVPQPQMAAGYTTEDNGMTYVITLRDGLLFHDGEPVRSADCIASIKRWSARDGFGRAVAAAVGEYQVVSDKVFKIKLAHNFPLLIDALGKSNSSQCFIMPERMATVDPTKQITESIGSGPYRFLREEWVPGSFNAFARFDKYVPRSEPPSGIAGGKIAGFERVAFTVIDDPSTAMSALMAGEQDYWPAPADDLLEVMKGDPSIVVSQRTTSNSYYMLQVNHLQPPFNNPGVRRALAMAINQVELISAIQPDPKLVLPCYSFYDCQSPYGIEDNAAVIKTADLKKAKEALAAAGYKGEKVVLLAVSSPPRLSGLNQVLDNVMRKLGMNVELQAMDFATMATRRTSKEPVEAGGWSGFITGWTGGDVANPAVNQLLHGAGEKGWFGWANDPKLEALKTSWFRSADPAERAVIAKQIQVQAFETLPYIPLGATSTYHAYRADLKGVFPAPVNAYWNISKGDKA